MKIDLDEEEVLALCAGALAYCKLALNGEAGDTGGKLVHHLGRAIEKMQTAVREARHEVS